MLGQIQHDADRVTRLITELLDISRLEAGRLALRRAAGRRRATLAARVVEQVAMAYPDLDADGRRARRTCRGCSPTPTRSSRC